MYFQPGLFRLPIPKIEDTCNRYLAALKPVAPSDSAFSEAQKAVDSFRREGSVGQGCVAMLCPGVDI